jgi:hypothetical protein
MKCRNSEAPQGSRTIKLILVSEKGIKMLISRTEDGVTSELRNVQVKLDVPSRL